MAWLHQEQMQSDWVGKELGSCGAKRGGWGTISPNTISLLPALSHLEEKNLLKCRFLDCIPVWTSGPQISFHLYFELSPPNDFIWINITCEMRGKPPGVSGRGDVRPRGKIFVSGFKYLCSDKKVTHPREAVLCKAKWPVSGPEGPGGRVCEVTEARVWTPWGAIGRISGSSGRDCECSPLCAIEKLPEPLMQHWAMLLEAAAHPWESPLLQNVFHIAASTFLNFPSWASLVSDSVLFFNLLFNRRSPEGK